MCVENLVKFGHLVFDVRWRTDGKADRHAYRNTLRPQRERGNKWLNILPTWRLKATRSLTRKIAVARHGSDSVLFLGRVETHGGVKTAQSRSRLESDVDDAAEDGKPQ